MPKQNTRRNEKLAGWFDKADQAISNRQPKTQPESILKKSVKEYMEALGHAVDVRRSVGVGEDGKRYFAPTKGISDLGGTLKPWGISFCFEIKKPDGKLSFNQALYLERHAKAGALVAIVRGMGVLENLMHQFKFDWVKEKFDKNDPCTYRCLEEDWQEIQDVIRKGK